MLRIEWILILCLLCFCSCSGNGENREDPLGGDEDTDSDEESDRANDTDELGTGDADTDADSDADTDTDTDSDSDTDTDTDTDTDSDTDSDACAATAGTSSWGQGCDTEHPCPDGLECLYLQGMSKVDGFCSVECCAIGQLDSAYCTNVSAGLEQCAIGNTNDGINYSPPYNCVIACDSQDDCPESTDCRSTGQGSKICYGLLQEDDTETETETETETGREEDTETDSDEDSDTETEADTQPDSEEDTEADTDEDTEQSTDSLDTETDSEMATDSETDSDTGTDTVCETTDTEYQLVCTDDEEWWVDNCGNVTEKKGDCFCGCQDDVCQESCCGDGECQADAENCASCSEDCVCGTGLECNLETARCECVPETDEEFCLRLGASCGEVSAADNCGADRLVTDCGDCLENWLCGFAEANVCGLYREDFASICNPEGWCWEHPLPFMHALKDIHVASKDDVWVVGSEHLILHFDGNKWSGTFDGKRPDLNALWFHNSEDVWAVGDAGEVVRRQQGQWTSVATLGNGMSDLYSIYGFSPADLWVGSEHVAWHFTGTEWVPYSLPGKVHGIWGASSNDIWAVGQRDYSTGFIAHWDGSTWETESSITWPFTDVLGFSAKDVWATARGHLVHWNGVYWSDVSNKNCSSVWGTDADDLWFNCGYTIYRYDGENFTETPYEANTANKTVIGGSHDGTVLAVSENGTMERFISGSWYRFAPSRYLTSRNIDFIQVFDKGEGIAHLSSTREILVRRSDTWSIETVDVDYNRCLFGISKDDYWIGGQQTSSDPLAYHVEDNTISHVRAESSPSLRYPELWGIWGLDSSELWGVGETYWNYSSGSDYYNYGFYHYSDGTWRFMHNSATDSGHKSKVHRIDGASKKYVWAIDQGHTIFKLAGGSWQRFTTGSPLVSGDRLRGVWVENDSRVYFTGSFGVSSFDVETGFTPKYSLPPWLTSADLLVHSLRDSPGKGLVAVGECGGRGVIWAGELESWNVQSVFPSALLAIERDEDDLVVTGKGGRIFRYRHPGR